MSRGDITGIQTYFLAFLQDHNKGSFVLVSPDKPVEEQHKNFYYFWQGLIVVINDARRIKLNKQNYLHWKEELFFNYANATFRLVIFLIILIKFLYLARIESITAFILFTTLGGIILSFLVIKVGNTKNGSNSFDFCRISKNFDCQQVVNSHKADLAFVDLSVVYFTTQLVALVAFTPSLGEGIINQLKLMSLSTIPVLGFSLYYQAFIIKKWCILCLSIFILLITQIVLLSPVFSDVASYVNAQFTSILFLIALLVFAGWKIFKFISYERTIFKEQVPGLISFKRNPSVILSLLNSQQRINAEPWDCDIEIADTNAELKLIIVCNPFCIPCSNAHQSLDRLIDTKSNVSVTIRFAVDFESPNPGLEVIQHIVSCSFSHRASSGIKGLANYNRRLMEDWFKVMDLEKFRTIHKYKIDVDFESYLTLNRNWITENEIHAAPQVFLNGYKFSKPFNIEDLELIVNDDLIYNLSQTKAQEDRAQIVI